MFPSHDRNDGSGKRIKTKGKWEGGDASSVFVQAYNGTSWDTLITIEESTVDTEYEVSLDSRYTINNEIRVRVYKETGNNNKLYLDCIGILGYDLISYLVDDDGNVLTDDDFFLLIEG